MRTIRQPRDLIPIILALPLLAILLCSCSSRPTEDNRTPIQLTYRLMWDPADPDLPSWQTLGRWPQDLIAGRAGELFLSDEQNARVIHFTTDGELVSIIGREGSGPGEFSSPVDLAYDLQRDRLWVGERGYMKITRFTRQGDRFEYLDSFQARTFMIDRSPSLQTASEEDCYWTNGWLFGTEEIQNTLLQCIRIDGEIVRSMGEPWEPEWSTRGLVSRINECEIARIGDDRLACVWTNRPLVQIWSGDGEPLGERTFDTPEVLRPGPGPVEREGSEVFYLWFTDAAYCPDDGLLYVDFPVIDERRIDFYALDPNTLLIVGWYQMVLPESDEGSPWPSRLVVERDGTALRFYCIDRLNSTVMIIEAG
jgi:hypothetical protein